MIMDPSVQSELWSDPAPVPSFLVNESTVSTTTTDDDYTTPTPIRINPSMTIGSQHCEQPH